MTDDDLLSGDDSYELEDAEAAKPPKKKLPAWIIIPVIAVLGIVIFAASSGARHCRTAADRTGR